MASWNEWITGANMTLSEVLNSLNSARVGLDVKDKLYWSFYKIVELAIKEGNANFDVAKAAGAFKDLASRLDASDQKLNSNTAQLTQTVKHGENESISMDMLSPEIKQSINDGVWEVNINTSDIEVGAVGFTEVATNNFDYSIFDEHLLSDENIELYDASKVTKDSGFSYSTANIVEQVGWDISNYIPVPKGAELIATVNGNDLFNHIPEYPARKLAVFESNYKHVSTTPLSSLDNFIAEKNCFVRFVYESGEVVSATTTKSKKLKANSVEYFATPKNEVYFSKEPIEFFDENEVTEEGFAQRTGEIVEDAGLKLTPYIMVDARKTVNIKIDGIDRKESPISDLFYAKIGVFNTYGEWEETILFPDIKNQDLVFNSPKKIRVQIPKVYDDISITVDGVNKLAPEAMDLEVGDKNNKEVDLFIFMGQSNMAGRGTASQAPSVPSGHGYEFKSISNPTRLHDIVEPFGVAENNTTSGVTEGNKTGSMVSALANVYYDLTKTPIVGVSCSKGGTSINFWQPESAPLLDAINRFETAENWLINNGYTIRNKSMVWCQGESDGDSSMAGSEYKAKFNAMVTEMFNIGIENCYLVRIGNHRDNPSQYNEIINSQTEIAKETSNVILVSTKFDKMASDGLMKDQFHYTQTGYNIVGEEAGTNIAYHVNNKKEPVIYDWENQELYFSHK